MYAVKRLVKFATCWLVVCCIPLMCSCSSSSQIVRRAAFNSSVLVGFGWSYGTFPAWHPRHDSPDMLVQWVQIWRVLMIPTDFKTTSGFWKRTAAVLKFYFRFRFWPIYSHRHVIWHLPAKFHGNRLIGSRVMTSYPFFLDRHPAAVLDLIWVMLDHPRRSAIAGLSLILKFCLDPIYGFRDIG